MVTNATDIVTLLSSARTHAAADTAHPQLLKKLLLHSYKHHTT